MPELRSVESAADLVRESARMVLRPGRPDRSGFGYSGDASVRNPGGLVRLNRGSCWPERYGWLWRDFWTSWFAHYADWSAHWAFVQDVVARLEPAGAAWAAEGAAVLQPESEL